MPVTLVLTDRDVHALVDSRTAMQVVARAFKAHSRGQVVMPPKVYLPLPKQSDFRAMAAYMRTPPACGLKWVNVHPHNPARGLPTVMAVVIINDPATGFPRAILDGVSITKLRTAAAAAVAAKALARPDSRIAALIGCGAQALPQLIMLADTFQLAEVRVWGARRGEAASFCAAARRRVRRSIALRPVREIRAGVEGADLIVTLTPSRAPIVQRAWLTPGAHVNAIGADAPGKQELDPAILRDALVVVDEREQAIHGGELNVPVSRGLFRPEQIHATLGAVLCGTAPGRRRPDELTVFDSTGLAVHDVALGEAIVRRAMRRGRGRPIRLFSQASW